MREVFIIGLLIWYAIVAIHSMIETTNEIARKKAEEDWWNKKLGKEYDDWLATIEPLYRHFHTYPPDWEYRKVHAQRACDYTCQSCGRTKFSEAKRKANHTTRWHSIWADLHVHHIVALSKGGDNTLSNLTCLCQRCHEDRHPWMRWWEHKRPA